MTFSFLGIALSLCGYFITFWLSCKYTCGITLSRNNTDWVKLQVQWQIQSRGYNTDIKQAFLCSRGDILLYFYRSEDCNIAQAVVTRWLAFQSNKGKRSCTSLNRYCQGFLRAVASVFHPLLQGKAQCLKIILWNAEVRRERADSVPLSRMTYFWSIFYDELPKIMYR